MVGGSGAASCDVISETERMKALHDAHAKAVFRFLLQLTFGEQQAAEDLTQETMLRAWRNIDALNTNIETLRPWLLTVARRVAIDAGRAKRARPTEVGAIDLTLIPSSEDHIDRILGAEIIRHALARLRPEHRRVIIELYYCDRSPRETAARLGIPTGTVRSRTYHALRNLKAALDSPSRSA